MDETDNKAITCIQCFFKCYKRVEIILNYYELVVKLNNITKILHNSNFFSHASSFMYDGQCKRHITQHIRFLVPLHAESQLVQLWWNVFFMYMYVHVNISIIWIYITRLQAYCTCLDGYCERLHHFSFVSKSSVIMIILVFCNPN